jgi:hypothetical protein
MNQNRTKRRHLRRPAPAYHAVPSAPACPLCCCRACHAQIRSLRAQVAELRTQVHALSGDSSSDIDDVVEQALAELSAAWGIEL